MVASTHFVMISPIVKTINNIQIEEYNLATYIKAFVTIMIEREKALKNFLGCSEYGGYLAS